MYNNDSIKMNVYWNLFQLTERLLSHCNKHKISIWCEFGTLIGLKRHNGIIPWDYDGDFGLFIDNRDRLIETYMQEYSDNIILDVHYYNDYGCFVIRFDDNKNDIVDIVFYEQNDSCINSCMNDQTKKEYPSITGYTYPNELVFPFRETLFVGYSVLTFNQFDEILKIEYGNWNEYPKAFDSYYDTDIVKSPFNFIDEYIVNNFDELKLKTENSKKPFVVRNMHLLDFTEENFRDMINAQESGVYGYSSSIKWTLINDNINNVWNDFYKNKLSVNIVDSPIDNKQILCEEWNEYVKEKLGEHYNLSICWVFTNAFKITYFHTDPNYAGGFMKLLYGKKIWWCINKNDMKYLEDKGHTINTIAKMDMYELLQLEESYLWGKITVGMINNNDFLWFPVKCAHRVMTLNSSFGIGGYL